MAFVPGSTKINFSNSDKIAWPDVGNSLKAL